MKVEEVLVQRAMLKVIGLVWYCEAPPFCLNLRGRPLDLVERDGVYRLIFKISAISGWTGPGGAREKPGDIINLWFGEGADIQFYLNESEGKKLYKEGVRKLRSIFREETISPLRIIREKKIGAGLPSPFFFL
jgi:hypothetical protein